jgi:prepilin-type N-terminal cleavage/methylation domain-containing protein
MSASFTNCRNRQALPAGFTLIELLVVIAIIAILGYAADYNGCGMPDDGWLPFNGNNAADPPAAAARAWGDLLIWSGYISGSFIRTFYASRGGSSCTVRTSPATPRSLSKTRDSRTMPRQSPGRARSNVATTTAPMPPFPTATPNPSASRT